MSRPGITYQDVATAAAQLKGQTENPTVDRIREILATGSKSTIARHLKAWKLSDEAVSEADPDIPAALISLVKGLWDRIKSEADEHITHHQQIADKQIAEACKALTEAQKQSAHLEAQVDELTKQLQQEKKSSTDFQASLIAEKKAHAILSERNNQLNEKLKRQTAEQEKLHQLLSHVQTNLEHCQMAMQRLREEQLLSAEKQKAAHALEKAKQQKEIDVLYKAQQASQRTADQQETALALAKTQIASLTLEKEAHYQQLQTKMVNEKILQTQWDQLSKAHQAIQLSLENKNTKINAFEKQIGDLSGQLGYLKHALNENEKIIQVLKNENLNLIQAKSQLEGQLGYVYISLGFGGRGDEVAYAHDVARDTKIDNTPA